MTPEPQDMTPEPLDDGFEFWCWTEPGNLDPPRLIATYRLPDGLACSLWLVLKGTAWVVEGLTLHPANLNVAIGPRRRKQTDTADLAALTTAPAPPITARLIRKLRLGEIELDLRERLGQSFYLTTYRTAEIERIRDQPRRRKEDRFYLEIAAAYVGAMEGGGTNHPAQYLAEQFNRPEGTIYRWIHEARRRGLLSKTMRGKAGGDLTAKAEQLMLDMKEEE